MYDIQGVSEILGQTSKAHFLRQNKEEKLIYIPKYINHKY